MDRFPLGASYSNCSYFVGQGTSGRILPATLFIHPNYALGEWENNHKVGLWTYWIYIDVPFQLSFFFFLFFTSQSSPYLAVHLSHHWEHWPFSHCNRCLRA